MLKITKENEGGLIRVMLCGRFKGEFVSEIEKVIDEDPDKAKQITIDLANVTFVDRTAMEFLCHAKSRKIQIENIPAYVIRWIAQETCHGSSVEHSGN